MEFQATISSIIAVAIICFQDVESTLKKNDKSVVSDLQKFYKQKERVFTEKSLISEAGIHFSPNFQDSSPSTEAEDSITSPSLKVSHLHQRYRRSFGTKTICIPVLKKKCKMVKYGGIEKNFCVKFTQITCTALD